MFLDRLVIAGLAWTVARLSAQLAPKPKPIPYGPFPMRAPMFGRASMPRLAFENFNQETRS